MFLLFNGIYGVTCFYLFVRLSMATITDKPPAVFVRPACPTCGSRMLLVRIFPDRPGQDQHTYACSRCADEITEIVRAPRAPFTEMIK
jgi:DNA-directed RNA polymerase subunit RPC12/RpoP